MIGKGQRNNKVKDSIVKNGAVYFAASGGAGALLARSIKKSKVIAYEDLGPEAIMELEVNGFPCIVAIDARGNDLYSEGMEEYRKEN
jgi:fumarate hydratase subunit beta